MNPPPSLALLGSPPPSFKRLQKQLAETSWICQGSVVSRPLIRCIDGRKVKKGPYYLWTCKVKGRTVCIALSQPQYQALAEAIANHRQLHKIIERMHTLSIKTILKMLPGVTRRK